MSTYEARCATATRRGSFGVDGLAKSFVTPEQVDAAVLRGRRERSLAVWSVLRAVFGRPGLRDNSGHGAATAEHGAAPTR
ncbi:MAG: hypothetical protein AB7L90_05395 [Hyphomicrobiaceae bacterium]